MAVTHWYGPCRCGAIIHAQTLPVGEPRPLCRRCTAADAPVVALARIARVSLWRRALAWLRCLRLHRVIRRRVRASDALEAQRANAAANQAAWDAWTKSIRCPCSSCRAGSSTYVRPPPTATAGELDRYSG